MDGTMWYHSTRTAEIARLLSSGELGSVRRVHSAFTFKAPNDEWLHGGNGRTDKTREPFGVLGDAGWYPVSAILFAYNFELPERVMATSFTLNRVDTLVSVGGTIWFSGGRMATFDAGVELPHRSYYEIVCQRGVVRVDDLIGGQGRTGDFRAYEVPFVGSKSFIKGDVMGRDEEVTVEACDHVIRLVENFAASATSTTPAAEWPRRTLAVHTVLSSLFRSVQEGGAMVKVES